MKRLATLITAISFLTATGCGGDDSVTTDDFCNQQDGVFQKVFDKLFECNPEFLEFLGVATTPEQTEKACLGGFAAYVEDGTAKYGSREALDACLAAIEAADCDTYDLDNLEACEPVLVGLLVENDACEAHDQCADGLYCDESGTGTCGACAPEKADGEACTEREECAGGMCGSDDKCRIPGQVGDTCAVNDDCVGRLVCGDDSKCAIAPEWKAGDTCDSFEADCGFPLNDLYCDQAAGECKAFLNIGDDCSNPTVAICDLVHGETCDDGTTKCIAPTEVGLDDDCHTPSGTVCEAGLECSSPFEAGGTCRAPIKEGDACDADDEQPCGITLYLECVEGACQYGEYAGECPLPENN